MRKKDMHCTRFFLAMVRSVIRAATPLDVPWIVNAYLTSTTKEETRGYAADEWVTFSSAKELNNVWAEENRLKDGSEVVVAEKDGKVIGFIVFKIERDCVYIDNNDIVREEQRKGVGKAVVAYVESIALANGYSLMKTDTTENAEGVPWKSYGFWIRMGYGDTGERLPTKMGLQNNSICKEIRPEPANLEPITQLERILVFFILLDFHRGMRYIDVRASWEQKKRERGRIF